MKEKLVENTKRRNENYFSRKRTNERLKEGKKRKEPTIRKSWM